MTPTNKFKEKPAHLFVIEMSVLRDRPIEFDEPLPLAWLTEELAPCEYECVPIAGHLEARVEASSGGILIQGSVSASIHTACCTCLRDVHLDVSPSITTFMMPKPAKVDENRDEELTPEDLEREWYEGESLALDNLVRDAIMLELPMNPKCGADCPGIPGLVTTAHAHPEQRIDPRLAKLASIKLEKEN